MADVQRWTHRDSPQSSTQQHSHTLMVPTCRDGNLTARRAAPGAGVTPSSAVPKCGDRTGTWTCPQCHLGASGRFFGSRGTNTGTQSFRDETRSSIAAGQAGEMGNKTIKPSLNPWHEHLIPCSDPGVTSSTPRCQSRVGAAGEAKLRESSGSVWITIFLCPNL